MMTDACQKIDIQRQRTTDTTSLPGIFAKSIESNEIVNSSVLARKKRLRVVPESLFHKESSLLKRPMISPL
jgi:hypothetical protein